MSGGFFVLPKIGGVFVLGGFCPQGFVRGAFVQGSFSPGLVLLPYFDHDALMHVLDASGKPFTSSLTLHNIRLG